MRNNQVRLKDIAEASGVAVATVSAALNGTGRIGNELKEKIRLIAQNMNYKPNDAARLLKQKKTNDIGFIVSDDYDTIAGSGFLLPMLVKFVRLCSEEKIRCQVEFFNPKQHPGKLPSLMTNGLAGGILHCGYVCPAVRDFMEKNPAYPLVSIEEESLYSVCSNTEEGAYDAIRSLAALGHRGFGALLGPSRFHAHAAALTGFRRAVSDFGLDCGKNETWISRFDMQPDREALENGIRFGEELFAKRKRPSAVLVGDVRFARGIIHAALRKGLSVPEDLSIMTLYGSQAELEQTYPALSSVRRDLDGIFFHAYRILRVLMDGRIPSERRIYIQPKLSLLNSTCRYQNNNKNKEK